MPKTKKTKKRGEKKDAAPTKKKSAKRTKKRKIAKEILDGVKQMRKRRPKPEPEPEQDIPTLPVGSIVRYYDLGTRWGELVEVKKGVAIIRPYGPEGQRNAKIPVSEIQVVDEHDNPIETKMPTPL
jgi:hypothetical protein